MRNIKSQSLKLMLTHIFIIRFTILTLWLEWSIMLIPLCLLYFTVHVLGAFQEIIKSQGHPGFPSFVQDMAVVPKKD